MSRYLASCLCRGKRPECVPGMYSRTHLISHLMRERNVARFIVAPYGYGKTCLAFEYAETVFQFRNVFWINASSPCFLRDLDAGIIASTISSLIEKPYLVVFDDLALFDSYRCERFSKELDFLLDEGAEVIVCTSPFHDAFHSQKDRLVVTEEEMLLSPEELRATVYNEADFPTHDRTHSPYERVPFFAWERSGSRKDFLRKSLDEEMPSEQALVIFLCSVLQFGNLNDLYPFFKGKHLDFEPFIRNYFYVGIDIAQERFECAAFGIEDIASAFRRRLDLLVLPSAWVDPQELISHLADVLLKFGLSERSCELVRFMLVQPRRSEWLARQGGQLCHSMAFMEGIETYASLGVRYQASFVLRVDEAFRRFTLGDYSSAQELLRKAVSSSEVDSDRLLEALCFLASLEDAQKVRACEKLKDKLLSKLSLESRLPFDNLFSVNLSLAIRAIDEAARKWCEYADASEKLDLPMLLCGAFTLERASFFFEREVFWQPSFDNHLNDVAQFLCKHLSLLVLPDDNWVFNILLYSLEKARIYGLIEIDFDDETATQAQRCFDFLSRQREELQNFSRKCEMDSRNYDETHPQYYRSRSSSSAFVTASQKKLPPVLSVNLFGGLEVAIGSTRVEPELLRRKKLRAMLALLVINRGREISCDKLISQLWPETLYSSGKKNFYAVWANLQRVLGGGKAACPYLIRHHNGVRLDAAYLSSDVIRFEELCKTLFFEKSGYGGWEELYSQISDVFLNDVLPGDNDNDAIESYRNHCRNYLVDALVAASERLSRDGQTEEAMMFARSACERDRLREDAYIALMRAQFLGGKRTAAIETFFRCKRILSEELGIDPSREAAKLYQNILDDES